tara:strand:- start:194 stop:460 length:267 start_codon:yes stop_codon:yes gene_type:complete
MTPTPESEDNGQKKSKLIEDLFILLCIISLWPVVLGWTEAVYQYLLYIALAGLVWIFVRRIRRFHEARDALRDGDGGMQIEEPPRGND